MILTLPWPPKELSPNARLHWAQLAKAKKAYRAACAWTAKEQGAKPIKADQILVKLTFHAPNRRAYDMDNALARMKSGLDGLADVIGVDDSKWAIAICRSDEIGGFVKVKIEARNG